MKVYLAGCYSRPWVFDSLVKDIMKIYLAGENGKNKIIPFVHGGGGLSENLPRKSAHIREFQERKKSCDKNNDEGGCIPELDEDISGDCGEGNRDAGTLQETIRGSEKYSRSNDRKLETILENRGGFSEEIKNHRPFILESFYYADETTEKLIPYFGDFLLDSGAFTFMSNSKTAVNWEEYLERYADFIKRNQCEKYFELDIDYLVGYEKVKEYRRRLEKLTGKQPIPVFHKIRGLSEFTRMCEEFPYVAIGASGRNEDSKWTRKHPEALQHFIQTAHKHGSKIHGLGFTNLSMLPKLHFDSVDSTAWTTGNRFGFVYRFNGTSMEKILLPEGKRLKDSRQVALINYTEWIKYQRYAERHL